MVIKEQTSEYDFMVTGATEEQICKFKDALEETPWSGVVSVSYYLVPKGFRRIPVLIVSASTHDSRDFCFNWWGSYHTTFEPDESWPYNF